MDSAKKENKKCIVIGRSCDGEPNTAMARTRMPLLVREPSPRPQLRLGLGLGLGLEGPRPRLRLRLGLGGPFRLEPQPLRLALPQITTERETDKVRDRLKKMAKALQ